MAVNLSPVGGVAAQFFTNTGAVLTGGKLYTYLAGTTTPAVTYTTSAANTSWTNPIVLDSAGRVSGSGEIWLTVGYNYKFVLKDSNDVLIGTYDSVPGQFNTDASLVTYTPAGTGAVTTTVQNKLRQYVSVIDFGADPTGATDSATEIQAAINYVQTTGGTLWFPPGLYLVGTQLDVAVEGMVFLGAGRDVTGTSLGTIIRTTAAINLFSFTTGARRTILQNMMLDGNSIGLSGADVATPKVTFAYCTIKGFVDAGLTIRSFSTLVNECDVYENLGHGIWYNDDNANQSRIVGGAISGNAKNGVFVDTTLGYPDGIYISGVDMENNCSAGNGSVNYAHIKLGGGVSGVFVTDMYHENDLDQTGYASQLFYNIGDGCDNVYLTNIKASCSTTAKFNYQVRAGASVQPLSIKNYWAGGVGIAIINNEVGASGALYTENVLQQNVSGFQSKLVDYAGAPTYAGTSLTNSPARLVAKIYPSASQTISSTAAATIQFNTVIFDPASMASLANYGIDVREEGYYQINVRISMNNYTAGEIAIFNVRVAGTTYEFSRTQLSIASSLVSTQISTIVKCNAADRITVQAAKTTNNFDIVGDSTYTNLSVVKVAQDAN